MQTMTRVSAVESQPVELDFLDGILYDGIRLITDDPEKVIPFVDQLLFFLRIQRFKTRPVTIRERQGVVEIHWSGRKPRAFRDRLVEVSSVGEHLDCFQVSAASTRPFQT